MKSYLSLLFPGLLITIAACVSNQKSGSDSHENKYHVAAYVWPSCHDEERSREVFWGEGEGEWEIIKKGDPRFEGHYQPRIPLWGYQMDDDPVAFEKKIRAATEHGVNTFIFDWYWYDGEPFLESTLNKGFLVAPNNELMDFYLMWANHDVNGTMWNRYRYPKDTILWEGEVNWDQFKPMVERVISQYFKESNYFLIDGEPVFSIFSFRDLVNSFGDLAGTREALDYFRAEVKKAGFPGLHLQMLTMGMQGEAGIIPEDEADGMDLNEIAAYLGISSMTTYNWRMAGISEDYVAWAEEGIARRNKWDERLDIPYFPVVSVGWDNTPRYGQMGQSQVVHRGNTPESFAAYLQQAKSYADQRPEQPPLILINAWNEWVEGAYLEPDMKWGYGYLEAVKKVMSGKYDRYQ